MPLILDAVYDLRGNTPRKALPGDITLRGESLTTVNSNTGVTLTAPQLLSGILNRTGTAGAGYNDATPSAVEIVNSLLSGYVLGSAITQFTGYPAQQGVTPGLTSRLEFINNGTGFTSTITAGTDVTLAGTMTVATNTIREFLITILNGTPQQIFSGTTTNSSAVVTGLTQGQTNLLTVGMSVSGTSIQAGSTIIAVNPGVGITLSATATASGTVALTFGPRVSVQNLGSRSL
jgi:hypothetical protein